LKKDATHRIHEICEIVGVSRDTYKACRESRIALFMRI